VLKLVIIHSKKNFVVQDKYEEVAEASNFVSGKTYKLKDTTMEQDRKVNDIRELGTEKLQRR
jgi:hypothetical protein